MLTEVHLLEEWIPEQMSPGTLFVMEQSEAVDAAGKPYCAILACPVCGCLGMITRQQYAGLQPMICGSGECSAEYALCEGGIRYRRPH